MSEYLWGVYRLLHNPPGTPRELRCVGCNLACAGACLASSGIPFYFAKKSARVNGYKSFALAGLGGFIIMTGAVFLRLAYENKKYNEMLTMEFQKELRKKRLENKSATPSDTGGCPVMH